MRFARGLFWLCFSLLTSAPILAREGELIFAFRNYKRPNPSRMILVGEIQSKTKMPELHDKASPFLGYDSRLDQVTVKVMDRRGIKVGQKLYVIDKDPFHKKFRDGLIVGEIEVISILNSPFYGWVLTGKGILLRVRKGHFVARTLASERLEKAYVLKKRGDYFASRKDYKHALKNYNDALLADSTLPEASAALGDIYLQMARDFGGQSPVRSLAAYRRAWKSRKNFRYEYEKISFYKNYIETIFLHYKERLATSSRENYLEKHLNLAIQIAKAGRQLRPKEKWFALSEAQARFYRYRLFEAESSSEERKERDTDYDTSGLIIKKLIEEGYQSPKLAEIGILYYKEMLDRTKALTPKNLGLRKRIQRVLGKLIREYNLFHQDLPRSSEVDRIILFLEEAEK